MNRASLGVGFAAAVVAGGALGYLLGRLGSDPAPVNIAPPAQASQVVDLERRLATAERERDELRAMAQQARTAVAPAEPPGRGAGTAADGMSGATQATGASPLPEAATDPRPAGAIVAALRDALGKGDADGVTALLPEIAARKTELVGDLSAMLASAESLFAMERLAELLGATGDPAVVPALQALLARENNSGVRTAAIRALGTVPDPGSVEILSSEFRRDSGSPMPPSVAATSLGAIGTPDAVAALRQEIEGGGNRMVRMFALRALADRSDPGLAPFFLQQATRADASDEYRIAAVQAIARSGSTGSVAQLEQIISDPARSRGLQEAAKRAINELLGREVYPIR